MKRFGPFVFLASFLLPAQSYALGGAPEMFGVGEVVINDAHFDNPETLGRCNLTREMVSSALNKAIIGTGVPAFAAADAPVPTLNVARIQLEPQISTYVDDGSLECISWVGLSLESKTSLVVPPVSTARNMTALYWQKHLMIVSGESIHGQRVTEALQQLAAQFVQQFKADQPPTIGGK